MRIRLAKPITHTVTIELTSAEADALWKDSDLISEQFSGSASLLIPEAYLLITEIAKIMSGEED